MSGNGNDASQVQQQRTFYEKNSQVISNISQLQLSEKELMQQIQNPMLSAEEKKILISKMNELAQTRANLFALLRAGYDNYKYSIMMSSNIVNDQVPIIETTEYELQQARQRLSELEQNKRTERRKMEINTYYSKRASAYARMVASAAVLLVVWLGLVVISNMGLMPSFLFNLGNSVLFVAGVFWIGMQWIDISSRDDMNWDNYNWYFIKDTAPEPTVGVNEMIKFDPWQVRTISCIGAECCAANTVYDSQKNQCLPIQATNAGASEVVNTARALESFGNITTKDTPFIPSPRM